MLYSLNRCPLQLIDPQILVIFDAHLYRSTVALGLCALVQPSPRLSLEPQAQETQAEAPKHGRALHGPRRRALRPGLRGLCGSFTVEVAAWE